MIKTRRSFDDGGLESGFLLSRERYLKRLSKSWQLDKQGKRNLLSTRGRRKRSAAKQREDREGSDVRRRAIAIPPDYPTGWQRAIVECLLPRSMIFIMMCCLCGLKQGITKTPYCLAGEPEHGTHKWREMKRCDLENATLHTPSKDHVDPQKATHRRIKRPNVSQFQLQTRRLSKWRLGRRCGGEAGRPCDGL